MWGGGCSPAEKSAGTLSVELKLKHKQQKEENNTINRINNEKRKMWGGGFEPP